MWLNYLKISLRAFLRDRLFSFINVFGLAVGLASVILIGLYVGFELSYDRFHPDADRLYRVMRDNYPAEVLAATNMPPAGLLLKEEFPEIVESARLLKSAGSLERGELVYSETGLHYADPAFLTMFGFEWLGGDPATALDSPTSIVISESIGRKYFGDENPLGQTLRWNSTLDLQVTAVYRDFPANSHMAPDFIMPMQLMLSLLGEGADTTWQRFGSFHTYIKLAPGADIATVDAGMPAFMARHLPVELTPQMAMPTIPVTDIHLHSNRRLELEVPGSLATVITLTTVAIGIVLIACFNFTNLATARSMLRSKEVGVRKSIGAERGQLVRQFLGESFAMTLLATVLAIGLVEIALPAFVGYTGKPLSFDVLADGTVQLGLLALVIAVSCLAGAYPALYLASFKPAQVLKRKISASFGDVVFRNLLVILQFSISILLLIATTVVILQNRYARDIDLGFEDEQLVVLRLQNYSTRWEALKAELLRNPDISFAAASNQVPGNELGGGVPVRAAGNSESHELAIYYVGYDFFETYGIAPVAGRLFSPDFPADLIPPLDPAAQGASGNFIINEAAAREYGWTPEAALAQFVDVTLATRNYSGRIVGVVPDSHFESLRYSKRPMIFVAIPAGEWDGNLQLLNTATLRLSGNNVEQALQAVDTTWRSVVPEVPVDRRFLSDNLHALYTEDTRLGQLFSSSATLAILIACLGLLGLATFNTQRRIKEIGIRKVMGGSVWSIVWLLTNDFSKLVLIANVIAWPAAYYVMDGWLQNFAYRIDLTPLVFIGSGAIALCIAWVTVGGTAAKAATQKPVLALRYE